LYNLSKGNEMKTLKTLVAGVVLATVAFSASAQHYQHGGRGSEANIGLGLIIGSLGTALIMQNREPVYVQPAPVYVQPVPQQIFVQPPVYVQPQQPQAPAVVYLQDGTRLTYVWQSGIWVDPQGRAYNLPR
jgi:hypothetical protein